MLGSEGPFAQALTGFNARLQQQQLADAIEDALDGMGTLVAEAETGVGKTFAYLVPAILSGGKVLISTGTKNLQDQLFEKDLPIVINALGSSTRTALLKGRANYLCLHRMKQTEHDHHWRSKQGAADFIQVRKWSATTQTGDIGELSSVPEDAEVWPRVTSNQENCLGLECPDYGDCHVVNARRKAQEADLVVINHHLFFADMALKEEGFGELLPSANAVILDEAHQLPDVASNFFGQVFSHRQVQELCKDTVAEQLSDAPDMQSLRDTASMLDKASRDLLLSMQSVDSRGAISQLIRKPAIDAAIDQIDDALTELLAILEIAAERGKGLESCLGRGQILKQRLARIRQAEENQILWYECFKRGYSLNLTPLDVGNSFEQFRKRFPCAWIFTSATLAVGDQFDHFTRRLGLEDFTTCQFGSPFDFRNNAMLYLPGQLPEPSDRRYTEAMIEDVLPLIRENQGRVFLLFTSYRALNQAADLLEDRIDFPLLVQGEMPRSRILSEFRELGNAVLLGTSSFWEGVDVRGDALSLVIIDKLPFASPGDPVLSARLDAIKERGGNPFMEYQVPQAVISLKQGAGRLIRDVNDRGMLVICDPRIRTKFYGKTFLRSLPDMGRTQDRQQALDFLKQMRDSHEAVGA